MPGLYIQFLYRSPLILCIISRHPYNLNVQLDIVYNQVISILSKSMLRSIYGKMGDNFDLRRYLNDIDKRINSCVKGFNEDPVVFLSGFRILPLELSDREFIIHVMSNCINSHSPNVIFFFLIKTICLECCFCFTCCTSSISCFGNDETIKFRCIRF